MIGCLRHDTYASAEERSLPALEQTLAACRREREQAEARLREAELRLEAGREWDAHRFHLRLPRRAQPTDACLLPRCRKPRCCSDLIVGERCPHSNCRTALTSLLTRAPRAGLDSTEYPALLGALGVLVGLALATSAA